jgi:hypothetical protein
MLIGSALNFGRFLPVRRTFPNVEEAPYGGRRGFFRGSFGGWNQGPWGTSDGREPSHFVHYYSRVNLIRSLRAAPLPLRGGTSLAEDVH